MARPKKQGADWFRHDADMSSHRKIQALEKRFGLPGYAIWCKMLEALTSVNDDNELYFDALELELRAADFGIATETFEGILNYCFSIRLFKKRNDENGGFYVSSPSLCESLAPVYEKRKNAKKQVSGAESRVSVTENMVSGAESTQSRVEYSRVEKSREENKKNNSLSLREKVKNENFWDEIKNAFVDAVEELKENPAVEEEARALDANTEAERFWNYYAKQGWVTKSGVSLTDLEAAVRHFLTLSLEWNRKQQGRRKTDKPFSQRTSEEQHKQLSDENDYILSHIKNGNWKRNFEEL